MAVTTSTESLMALLRQHLLSASGVAALVGGRVHGAHLQTPDDRTTVYPMVVLELSGGGGSPSSTFQATQLYVYAYDRESAGGAAALYDTVFSALQHETLRRDGVALAGYAMEQERPTIGYNDAANAYYARGLWIVRAGYRST